MIVIVLLIIFALIGVGLAYVAWAANARKRAGQNPQKGAVGRRPEESRAIDEE